MSNTNVNENWTKTEWKVDGLTVYALDADGVQNDFSCLLQGNGRHGAAPRELEANANLIAAAPDLAEAQSMGTSLDTPDFLDWIANRLVNVYGENHNVDFVLSLRERANAGRKALAKARGEL